MIGEQLYNLYAECVSTTGSNLRTWAMLDPFARYRWDKFAFLLSERYIDIHALQKANIRDVDMTVETTTTSRVSITEVLQHVAKQVSLINGGRNA